MSADMALSSFVTLPFLSRPKALPPRYENLASIEERARFASLGVVCDWCQHFVRSWVRAQEYQIRLQQLFIG